MDKAISSISSINSQPDSPDEELWRHELLAQCEAAVKNLDFSTLDLAAIQQADPPSLYDFFAELETLRNEQKRGNRKFSDVLSNFTSLLENMRDDRQQAAEKSMDDLKASGEKVDRSLALGLIDLRDRLDRILANAAHAPMEVKVGLFGKKITPSAWKTHCESLKILSQHFQPMLAAAGLERISTIGLCYNPSEMKAVSAPANENLGSLRVIRELLPGYHWQGQCLRPAEVEVQSELTSI
ncbi:MAG: nucleotide exchange factor GrpE [Verrucomicrobiales bacterium]|nr:nucleotide exchange factor GrpE [Verrucomicrobiales bacterium]